MRASGSVPGSCLLGLWPAVAACALAGNVFFLRIHRPGIVSGKLSDVAINFLLPVALVAACEWLAAAAACSLGRCFVPAGARARLLACGASALYFSLLQIVPGFTRIHAGLLHVLDRPFGGTRSFAGNIADPGDLIALVAAPLAALYLCRERVDRVQSSGTSAHRIDAGCGGVTALELEVAHAPPRVAHRTPLRGLHQEGRRWR